ncbi:hypothetical protein B9Z55_020517 [Caenorhabditis nigoni]|uniref:Uncharacterized protein n=1 Tax=Caenorhabditis nigoni TaxID=1611254 RepID=A0A2G5TN14_9PELO|nr:hypothetical protein B9Z55_020517 [Caenorhabditis nigoni]
MKSCLKVSSCQKMSRSRSHPAKSGRILACGLEGVQMPSYKGQFSWVIGSPHKTLTSSSHVHKKPETRDVVRSQTKASLRYKEPKGIVVGVTRSEVGSAQSVAVKTKDYTLENNSSQTKRSGEDDSIQKPSSSEASLKESQEGEEVVHAKSCISAKYIYNAKHNDAAKHNDKPSTSTKRKPSTTTTSSTATEPKYIQSKGI